MTFGYRVAFSSNCRDVLPGSPTSVYFIVSVRIRFYCLPQVLPTGAAYADSQEAVPFIIHNVQLFICTQGVLLQSHEVFPL